MQCSALCVALILSASFGACTATNVADIDNDDAVQGALLQAHIEHTDADVWARKEVGASNWSQCPKKWSKQASALQFTAGTSSSDSQRRASLQNRLAGACEDMCKAVGNYPKCPSCPKIVAADATPGPMTWEELRTHMKNLLPVWSHGEGKPGASALQVSGAKALADDEERRAFIQNTLAGLWEEMCKEAGAKDWS